MTNSTIDFYNKNAKSYADSTLNVDVSSVQDQFLKEIPLNGKILDAGCGSGRDSLKFIEKGFDVTAFDASKELTKYASTLTGLEVKHMKFEDMSWKNNFDGIWCMASLLHLNDAELKDALIKCSNALIPNGKFFACFKTGSGESLDEKGRYFNYTSAEKLKSLLDETKLFKNVKIFYNNDSLGRNDTTWINIIAESQKPELKLEKRKKFKI